VAWFDTLSLSWRARLPVILQTEASECGLACLAMVLGYHGVLTDLAALRSRHSVSLKGMTLTTLSKMAQDEQLGYRAVRLELGELGQLRLPAILHWDLNHFVVLKAVSNNRLIVHDPASGERSVTMEAASQRFTGVALELWPDTGFKPREEKSRIALSQLIGQVSGFWPLLGQVLLMSAALQVFVLIGPLFLQWIIDQVLVSRDSDLLTTLALGFLLMLLVQQGVSLMRSWLLLVINTSVRVQWTANIFSHLLRLPMAYFQKRHLGDVVSRTQSIDEIQRVLTSAFVEAIFDSVLMVVTLVMMFIYSPQLAWISIVAVLLYLLLRVLWYRPLYNAKEEQIVRAASLSTHFLETIRGVRAIKLFGRQMERRNAWQTLLVSETNASLAIQKLRILYGTARSLLSGSFNVLILWVGATQIMAGNLSVGMLMAFLSFRSQFDSRLTGLIDQAIELKMLRLHGERLADVVLTPGEAQSPRAQSERRLSEAPDIAIENVRFRYADQEPWVLDGLSLNIQAGEAVAITGASGCGKTTLVNLLMGVLSPVEGTIKMAGVPLAQLGNENWRHQVGTVMQDDMLFAGSIAENICFFDVTPDFEHMQACARMAAVHTDIERMPMGYQTLVGDMGTVLSGGQKQRVLLARALYKRPQVLILDEATSHLDLRHEAMVSRSISGLAMTRITVAHRTETLSASPRIIEMERGQVVFDGPPEAYLQRIAQQRADE
jgi:ATP-binding cassette subfamily B protein RaxB